MGQEVSNDIAFAWDKVNVRVEWFIVIKPENGSVRYNIISDNFKVVSVDAQFGTK